MNWGDPPPHLVLRNIWTAPYLKKPSAQLPITIFKKDFLEFLVPFFYWMGLQDHVPPFFPFLQSPPPVWSMTHVKEHMKGNLLPHTYTLSRN